MLALGTAPLQDRAHEVARLEAVLEELPAGGSPALVVEGEPGIGKTRLLAELAERTRVRGGRVYGGRAAEYESGLPFAAWVDALDEHVDEVAQQLAPADRAELARVLPSLETSGDRVGLVDERHRLHNAMRKLLGALAGEGLLVVVLDDLHWADSSSVDLIDALLRRPPSGQVLLALGFRSAQVGERLRAGVAAAERDGRVEVLSLNPLSLEATKALAGDNLDGANVQRIHRESGGNPFYVEELVRASAAGTQRSSTVATTEDVPPAVAAVLNEELRALEPDTRTVLQAAAVAGADFEPALIAAVAELSPGAVQDPLDALLTAGLVRPTGAPGTFAIRHPLVRRAVYESAGPAWRLGAHARAAAALQARGMPPEALAHHVALSAPPGDADAVGLLTAAAAGARTRAPASAADWYARALDLLPSQDEDQRLELLVQLADARVGSGRLEAARAALLEALEHTPPEDVGQRVRLVARTASTEHLLGRHEDAHARLQRALEDLTAADADERLALIVALSVTAFYRLDIDAMQRWGTQALVDGKAQARPAFAAAGAGLVGMGEAFLGRTAEARRACDEGSRLMEAATDEQLAGCLAAPEYLGLAEMYIERYEDALMHSRRGIAVARRTGQGERIPVLAVAGGSGAIMLGRIAEAIEMLDSAVDASRLMDSEFGLSWVLMNAAWAKWHAGDLVRARREGVEVLERLKALDDSMLKPNAATLVGQIELEDGDHRLCARILLEAGGGPEIPLIGGFWRVFVLESLARAESEGGRPEAAREAAELAMEIAPALELELTLGVAQRAVARVELDAGRAAEAAELALASAGAAERVGARLEAAQSRALAGRALATENRRDEAVEQLRAAAEAFDACGARRRSEAVHELLHRLGDVRRMTARGEAGVGGLEALTGREAEIADLVWDRRTNREIAEALFLSPKTIETHLRNIFAKVGVSTRVELARAVERAKAYDIPTAASS